MKFRLCRIRLAPTVSCLLAMAVLFFLTPSAINAQGLTGQLSGTVVDSSGGAVPGATVNVRNVATQVSRDAVTDTAGAFVIADLLAGNYDVTVSLEGFKTYVQNGVVLSANERVALRAIALQVGALSETISVTAEAARVQTQSSERSGLITQEQLKEVTLKGRDYMGMLKLLPGVVDTANREAPGWNNIGGLAINGGRNNTINLTYDGVTNLDTGSNTGPFLAPGPGLDRGNQGADLELSGRVRSKLRGDDQRHHQERQPRVSRRRLLCETF